MICLSGSSKDCVINLPNMKTPLAIFFFFFSDNIFLFCYIKVTIFRTYFFLGMILYGLYIDSKMLPPRVYRQIESKEWHRGHLYSLWILFSNNNSLFKMMANYVCNFLATFLCQRRRLKKVSNGGNKSIFLFYLNQWCMMPKESKYILMLVDK